VTSAESLWITDDGGRRYRIKNSLGTGGEGLVYLCETPVDDTTTAVFEVVIKEVRQPQLGDTGVWLSRNDKLRHVQQPGLVRVRDVFVAGPPHYPSMIGDGEERHGYVVMDYVRGRTLEDHVNDKAGTTATDRIIFLTGIATALDALHTGQGADGVPLVHGDVKPSNIVINDDGAPILVDLEGIRTPQSAPLAAVSLPYAAPELAETGYLPSPASDRFAFYATVAHVLIGEVPPVVDGTLDIDAILDRLRGDPNFATRHSLLEHLEAALRAAPDDRPAPLARWLNHLRASWSQSTIPPSRTPVAAPDGRRTGSVGVLSRMRRFSPKRVAFVSALVAICVIGGANVLAKTGDPDRVEAASGDTGEMLGAQTQSPPVITGARKRASATAGSGEAVPTVLPEEPALSGGGSRAGGSEPTATHSSQEKSPKKVASRSTPTTAAAAPLRRLNGTPESGNDHCGWWITAKSATLKYRGCVHHSVNGWYGGLQIKNTGSASIMPNLYVTDWTNRPDGSGLQQMSPGKWNGTWLIQPGETVYIIGGQSHSPTERCTAVQGRPINTGSTETWGSTPFILANGQHCTLPGGWSSPR
jgi:serine/threonine protein kinase